MRIQKFLIDPDNLSLHLPKGCRIRQVFLRTPLSSELEVWVEVDQKQMVMQKYNFRLLADECELPEGPHSYLGSVKLAQEATVHVYLILE